MAQLTLDGRSSLTHSLRRTTRERLTSISFVAVVSLANLHCSSDPDNGGTGGSTSQAGSVSGGTTSGGSGTGGAGAGGKAGGAATGGGGVGMAGGGASTTGGGGASAGGQGGSGGATGGAGGSGGSAGGAGGSGGATGGSGGSGGGGTFALTSSKLMEGAAFASDYTCAAGNSEKSLPLSWTAGPSETKSYAIVLLDTSGNNFNHWVIWDIPPTITMLPEGLPNDATLSTVGNAKQKAGSGQGYLGPCPSGMLHTYSFTVYALDVATLPDVMANTSTMQLSAAIQMHDIASAKLTGMSDAKMP